MKRVESDVVPHLITVDFILGNMMYSVLFATLELYCPVFALGMVLKNCRPILNKNSTP